VGTRVAADTTADQAAPQDSALLGWPVAPNAIDASMIPKMVRANTHPTTVMMADRPQAHVSD
jgi:hypothetical protein